MTKKNRSVIVPPDFIGYMLKDDRFVKYTEKSAETLENGLIGAATGFKIFESNNVVNTNATKYKIMACHPMGISLAFRVPPGELEAYRPERGFKDAMKGLCLYGAKVLRPDAIALATVNFS